MSENKPSASKKKLLENPFIGSLVVPIAIVLIGALIVLGVTSMLSTDRSHRDLVREMESKTFGNRWIAAYELSKLIATSSIPDKDIPWTVERLNRVYRDSRDPRTKDFIIVSLGALQHVDSLELFADVLSRDEEDAEGNSLFHALVAVGSYPTDIDFDWSLVAKFLSSRDVGLRQAAVLTLANHRVEEYQDEIEAQLHADSVGLRYSAAMGLIYFQNERALGTLREILWRKPESSPNAPFDARELLGLQMNVLGAVEKENWTVFEEILNEISEESENQQLALRAREILNRLKN